MSLLKAAGAVVLVDFFQIIVVVVVVTVAVGTGMARLVDVIIRQKHWCGHTIRSSVRRKMHLCK